jgi:hypothetical protein
MTYDVGNTCPGLGQAQKYGRVKAVNEIPTNIIQSGHGDSKSSLYAFIDKGRLFHFPQGR